MRNITALLTICLLTSCVTITRSDKLNPEQPDNRGDIIVLNGYIVYKKHSFAREGDNNVARTVATDNLKTNNN